MYILKGFIHVIATYILISNLYPLIKRGFEIYYRPLVSSEETTTDLTINSPILGIYKYQLVLKAL